MSIKFSRHLAFRTCLSREIKTNDFQKNSWEWITYPLILLSITLISTPTAALWIIDVSRALTICSTASHNHLVQCLHLAAWWIGIQKCGWEVKDEIEQAWSESFLKTATVVVLTVLYLKPWGRTNRKSGRWLLGRLGCTGSRAQQKLLVLNLKLPRRESQLP